MRNHETPNAAELYFNQSIFGQFYAVFADALAGGLPERRKASRDLPARKVAAAGKRDIPRQTLLDRLDGWFWRQEQKTREAYLARSGDRFELERRLAALERGSLWRYY